MQCNLCMVTSRFDSQKSQQVSRPTGLRHNTNVYPTYIECHVPIASFHRLFMGPYSRIVVARSVRAVRQMSTHVGHRYKAGIGPIHIGHSYNRALQTVNIRLGSSKRYF